jgi:hypothetical protein
MFCVNVLIFCDLRHRFKMYTYIAILKADPLK